MDWTICEEGYSEEDIDYLGNKFLIGNGYMGIRGCLEEYTANQRPAINLAGVYDQVPGKWRESVNAPNPLYITLSVQGEMYALPCRAPLRHAHSLNIRCGLHARETEWEIPGGRLMVHSDRFASMDNPHMVYLRYNLRSTCPVSVELSTGIDTAVWDINGPHFTRVRCTSQDGRLTAEGITGEKGTVVQVCDEVHTNFGGEARVLEDDGKILRVYRLQLEPGKDYILEKAAMIQTSGDDGYPLEGTFEGYEEALAKHTARWEKIWNMSQVDIDGDDEAMLALNYSIYHLNSIAPRHSRSMSIPARGLSGQVYKGAIFWDTEMFMFDYFLFTDPAVAKTLLRYRVDTLPGAMEKAASYGYDGAFYAWESQEGGIDACTDYNITDVFTGRPTRTYFRDKQVHVSAAMVYALVRYIEVTSDASILKEGGAKMLLECARFYYSLLLKRANRDFYEIHDVVGPDEYHERVNNNAYTNRMAKFTLEKAAEILSPLAGDPAYEGLSGTDDLAGELDKFAKAAQKLFVSAPDPDTGLIEQFDGYFALEDVSVETVRSRLLDPREYWGGANGVASHTQVNKQADIAAMLSMFPEEYSKDVLEKNWLYYEPRTEHGSSLSACMFALLACYIGCPDDAYPLFMKSAQQDLVKGGKLWLGLIFIGGTHPASSGGAWMVASRGFGGLQIRNGQLAVAHPALPTGWKSLSFRFLYKGKCYKLTATGETSTMEECSEGKASCQK